MNITCGPDNDQRIVSILLPDSPKKLAVFISGGLDSAILYYLLLLENKRNGGKHIIVPCTVLREEGSKYFAKLVIGYIHACYNIPYTDPLILGDPTVEVEKQVKSGVDESFNSGFDIAYTGLIEQLPQHMIGWQPIPYNESDRFKAPFKNLNKSHIIDLIRKLEVEGLFYVTHSCSGTKFQIGRCNACNGCNERSWGFEQLGIIDPGKI